ncbi:hypothetical protein [Ureibacillus massiliensis]|nr:hypothetical protein [Ureibacillus massiliensis]
MNSETGQKLSNLIYTRLRYRYHKEQTLCLEIETKMSAPKRPYP